MSKLYKYYATMNKVNLIRKRAGEVRNTSSEDGIGMNISRKFQHWIGKRFWTIFLTQENQKYENALLDISDRSFTHRMAIWVRFWKFHRSRTDWFWSAMLLIITNRASHWGRKSAMKWRLRCPRVLFDFWMNPSFTGDFLSMDSLTQSHRDVWTGICGYHHNSVGVSRNENRHVKYNNQTSAFAENYRAEQLAVRWTSVLYK